jgi:hypothetical protein
MKGTMKTLQTNLETACELLGFVWRSKTWWLTPVIVALVMLSAVVIFLEASALAPFIYVLF